MAEQINVLIADDHPIVRQGMEMLLEIQDDIEVIGVVENGQEAVNFVETQPPDVVLMDLNMPQLNGIDATKQIRDISPHTKVIVLTSHHQDAMVFPMVGPGMSYDRMITGDYIVAREEGEQDDELDESSMF